MPLLDRVYGLAAAAADPRGLVFERSPADAGGPIASGADQHYVGDCYEAWLLHPACLELGCSGGPAPGTGVLGDHVYAFDYQVLAIGEDTQHAAAAARASVGLAALGLKIEPVHLFGCEATLPVAPGPNVDCVSGFDVDFGPAH